MIKFYLIKLTIRTIIHVRYQNSGGGGEPTKINPKNNLLKNRFLDKKTSKYKNLYGKYRKINFFRKIQLSYATTPKLSSDRLRGLYVIVGIF